MIRAFTPNDFEETSIAFQCQDSKFSIFILNLSNVGIIDPEK